MTMEAVAGKNPISHVGKLYNLAAGLLAEAIVAETPEVAAADCFLVSRIGQPIDRPQMVHVRLALASPASTPPPSVAAIVRRQVAGIGGLWRALMDGTVRFDRWPLRGG
jgi:S-adenosylmethionine synthetase